jgi:hypothetical protein
MTGRPGLQTYKNSGPIHRWIGPPIVDQTFL